MRRPEMMKLPRIRARSRRGRCFELAGRGQLSNPAWKLVHGLSTVGGPVLVPHAWLELDGIVYDPVLDKAMPIDQYKTQCGALIGRRYTAKQAAALTHRLGMWGPQSMDALWRLDRPK